MENKEKNLSFEESLAELETIVKKLESIYKKNNIDVSLKLYEGKRHDLFHETNKLEVFNDILTYIKKEL